MRFMPTWHDHPDTDARRVHRRHELRGRKGLGGGQTVSGSDQAIVGKDVLLVEEDIMNSSLTVQYLMNIVSTQASSLKVCTLLQQAGRRWSK